MDSRNQRIEVGDLVALTRGHPCALRTMGGIPFTVTRIVTFRPVVSRLWVCTNCKVGAPGSSTVAYGGKSRAPIPVDWLTKFNGGTDGEQEPAPPVKKDLEHAK